jgi:serine phosphatase RsbU (regulator of sigma subunit)
MEIQIGVAKINKYASSESGDTLEVVERPGGGLSVVLADGQRSGKSAKLISNMVVRKVISLLAEGVRDGAAARAASDYLYTHRNGQVQSTLNILSIELESRALLITRNNPLPVLVHQGGAVRSLDERSDAVGLRRETRPVLTQFELQAGLVVATYTDGLPFAGERKGTPMSVPAAFEHLVSAGSRPQEIADGLMAQALTLEGNRPGDDISIVVIGVLPKADDPVRRMWVRLPIA